MLHPAAHTRLVRRTRWLLAVRAAALVMAVLAVLSGAAYLVARGVLVGGLHERLERALQAGEHGERRRPPATPPAAAPSPSDDDVRALRTFLVLLGALTLAGGAVALPAGYLLAGRALHPLEQAVQERSEFVALASHRLRTPLSVIRASAELALSGQGVAAPEALRTIVEQTRRMEGLAERLTALARAEAGAPSGAGLATDLARVARDVVADLAPAAAQAGVQLRLETGVPVWAAAAPTEVADMLSSVLENALRFTPAGGIVRVLAGVQGRWAFLEVRDQGPGIDPADLPRVTEPFFQGQRARGGTGLGLAITRAISERLHGRLQIQSALGTGTTVRILLPPGHADRQ